MKLFEFHKNREIAIMNVLWCLGIFDIAASTDVRKKFKYLKTKPEKKGKINSKIIQVDSAMGIRISRMLSSWSRAGNLLKETRCCCRCRCFSIHAMFLPHHGDDQIKLDVKKSFQIVVFIFIRKTISSGVGCAMRQDVKVDEVMKLTSNMLHRFLPIGEMCFGSAIIGRNRLLIP